MSGKRILSAAVVGSLCATAALAIAVLLFSEFHRTQGRILGTTALIALAGLLALPAGILLDQRRAARLARVLLTLAVAGSALALVAIWTNNPPDELGKAIVTVVVFALASTLTAALTARRNDRDPPSVRRLFAAAVALALVAASMVALAVWAEVGSELYFRFLGALVVGDALAVALQPILARASRAPTIHRLELLVDPGGERLVEVAAESFAAAAAKAIAAAEHDGANVLRVQRTPPPTETTRPAGRGLRRRAPGRAPRSGRACDVERREDADRRSVDGSNTGDARPALGDDVCRVREDASRRIETRRLR